jgi:hypothetical protein
MSLDFENIFLGVRLQGSLILADKLGSEHAIRIGNPVIDLPVVRENIISLKHVHRAISVLKLAIVVWKPTFHGRTVILRLDIGLLLLVLVGVDFDLARDGNNFELLTETFF